ncbi:MAG: CHAT domain-containing protein, partial [Chloroflexi bacterium]|nr:CHAT domain-containing protein [Chloroflexota bacterium]
MLELTLKQLNDSQVQVLLDGVESHIFELDDLRLTDEAQIRAFTDNPNEYGQRLYAALFRENSPAETALHALPKNPGPQRAIILVPDGPRLDSIPWEYASHAGTLLGAQYALVRALPADQRPQIAGRAVNNRRPLLFSPANPLVDELGNPVHTLDVETEWDYLSQVVQTCSQGVDLYRLPPTVDNLQKSLNGKSDCIVHFFGHGNQDAAGKAYLLFEQANGCPDPLPAAEFANLVRGKAGLVFLGACLSAAAGSGEFANLARLLVREGLPYVIGMQFPVRVDAAERITDFFYAALLSGSSVPEAMRSARQALSRKDRFQAGIPVLYAADPSQTQSFDVQASGSQVYLDQHTDLSDLRRPEGGFYGRQRELVEIGELLNAARGGPVSITLHGIGGVGKTALLWQAARRFAWRFPAGGLALSMEPLLPFPQYLGKLEAWLGIPESAAEITARVEVIYQKLDAAPPLLLALDNYETLIQARDDGDSEQEERARQLHRFLCGLPSRGVTLMASSRAKTGLPGEKIINVFGLQTLYGALLFMALAPGREGDLTLEGAQGVSRAVRGHPLALRLLGPVFDDEANYLSLNDFVVNLDAILPAAEDVWLKDDRHGGLRACFDFSLRHLSPELIQALARLSNFRAFFPDFVAAQVLDDTVQDYADLEKALPGANRSLNTLWGRGLLERLQFPAGDKTLYLYGLHPALRPFAAEGLSDETGPQVEQAYFQAMRRLGRSTYPAQKSGGIYASPWLAEIARRALPDLGRAAEMRADAGGSNLRFHTAFLLMHFGDLDGAMQLYQQSLEIKAGLGDLKGKSATLHQMAGIYVTRGDLDGAMQLYQQSLEIKAGLGDLQGKSATLHQMAGIYVTRGDLDGAIHLYQQSLEIKEGLGDLKGKSATLHQ